MYVTQHARERIAVRFTPAIADKVERILDGTQGEPGVIAYIVGNAPAPGPAMSTGPWWLDSNGDLLVAVAHDGSVETVFYRRSSQDISASYFGASKVVDMRVMPVFAQ